MSLSLRLSWFTAYVPPPLISKVCPASSLSLTSHWLVSVSRVTGASLIGADLRRARLFRAILRNANLTDARLKGADLARADLSGATWTDGERICAEGSIGRCN